MKRINEKVILQIIGLGIISGMRATFAASLTAHFFRRKQNMLLSKSKLGFIQSPAAAVITKVLSAAEATGDKLPNTPNRIVAPQILARVSAGAFAGAIISTANDYDIKNGVLIGGVTALAATFGTYYLRKTIDE